MRKIVIITAALTTLAATVAVAPASAAVLLAKRCTSSCTTLTANGGGELGITGNGAEWGSVRSGIVWVRDRTGKTNPRNWVSGSGIHWKYLGDDGWKATSSHAMKICASGKFWVKLRGPGIGISAVVDGSGSIGGSGRYTLAGHTHEWPHSESRLRF
jgi:hypothetical protein